MSRISRLTWDGTAEHVSQDQILRRERGQGNFPCSADHEQDWQPYPVGLHTLPYVLTIIHKYIIYSIHIYYISIVGVEEERRIKNVPL